MTAPLNQIFGLLLKENRPSFRTGVPRHPNFWTH